MKRGSSALTEGMEANGMIRTPHNREYIGTRGTLACVDAFKGAEYLLQGGGWQQRR